MNSPNNEDDPVFSDCEKYTAKFVLERVGSDRIKRRMLYLTEIFRLDMGDWNGIYLNQSLLRAAVESYYCDIYRLKFFRPVTWADACKKAAFTMKWIAKIHPVQIRQGFTPDKGTLMANEYFAICAATSLLDLKEEQASSNTWFTNYWSNLVYLLYYHSVPVESLCSELFLLQTVDGIGMPKG